MSPNKPLNILLSLTLSGPEVRYARRQGLLLLLVSAVLDQLVIHAQRVEGLLKERLLLWTISPPTKLSLCEALTKKSGKILCPSDKTNKSVANSSAFFDGKKERKAERFFSREAFFDAFLRVLAI